MTDVFTNGVFDILHVGHVRLLEFCASLGDVVIVGINSDESTMRLKGPTRPINCADERKEILQSLRSVDEVLVFDDDTPYELIKQVRPDIIVKGGDYTYDQVVGRDLVDDVRIFTYQHECSTTQTIQDMRRR